jgi:outer membrane biosynthesis protein TonB
LGNPLKKRKEVGKMLTIIESGSSAWALMTTDGELRVFSREQAGDWSELPIGEEAEQLGEDGSLILEALYEQETGDGAEAGPEPLSESEEEPLDEEEPEEEEEPEAEEEEPEAEEEDEPEEEEPEDEEPELDAEDEDEPEEEEPEEEEEEEEKPRPRRRAKAKAKSK